MLGEGALPAWVPSLEVHDGESSRAQALNKILESRHFKDCAAQHLNKIDHDCETPVEGKTT